MTMIFLPFILLYGGGVVFQTPCTLVNKCKGVQARSCGRTPWKELVFVCHLYCFDF